DQERKSSCEKLLFYTTLTGEPLDRPLSKGRTTYPWPFNRGIRISAEPNSSIRRHARRRPPSRADESVPCEYPNIRLHRIAAETSERATSRHHSFCRGELLKSGSRPPTAPRSGPRPAQTAPCSGPRPAAAPRSGPRPAQTAP